MILRRFTHHLKDQNWFAVSLDVLVVIVGIFLGMQVTEWNERQKLKAEEGYFLQRLHNEINENIERVSRGIDFRAKQLENLGLDLDYIRGLHVKWGDDQEWCSGINGSHIYLDYSAPVPALDELISTGKLWSLSNERLRQKLASHIGLTKYMQGAVSRMAGKSSPMNEAFPELIQGQLNTDLEHESSEKITSNCDATMMRSNSAFINKINNNYIRFTSYISLQRAYLERLVEIHEILTEVLNLEKKK